MPDNIPIEFGLPLGIILWAIVIIRIIRDVRAARQDD